MPCKLLLVFVAFASFADALAVAFTWLAASFPPCRQSCFIVLLPSAGCLNLDASSSPQILLCSTCPAFLLPHCCGQFPQSPLLHPCLITQTAQHMLLGNLTTVIQNSWQSQSTHDRHHRRHALPVAARTISKPPGCSSRNCVTSYTLPLMTSQQSSSLLCALQSSNVCFLVAGSVLL